MAHRVEDYANISEFGGRRNTTFANGTSNATRGQTNQPFHSNENLDTLSHYPFPSPAQLVPNPEGQPEPVGNPSFNPFNAPFDPLLFDIDPWPFHSIFDPTNCPAQHEFSSSLPSYSTPSTASPQQQQQQAGGVAANSHLVCGPLCGKTFASKSARKRHQLTAMSCPHNQGSSPIPKLQCLRCPKRFQRAEGVAMHLVRAHKLCLNQAKAEAGIRSRYARK